MSFLQYLTLQNGEVGRCAKTIFWVKSVLGSIFVGVILAPLASVIYADSLAKDEMIRVTGDVRIDYEKMRLYADENEVQEERQLITSVDLDTEIDLGENLGVVFSIAGETESDRKTGLENLLIKGKITNAELTIGKYNDVHFASETNFDSTLSGEYLEQDATGLRISTQLKSLFSLDLIGFRLQNSEFGEEVQGSKLAAAMVAHVRTSEERSQIRVGLVSDLVLADLENEGLATPAMFLQISQRWGNWSGLLEFSRALRAYSDVEPYYQSPMVTTVEFHYALNSTTNIGFVTERSSELFERPEQLFGIQLQQERSNGVSYGLELMGLEYSEAQQSRYELDSVSEFLLFTNFTF